MTCIEFGPDRLVQLDACDRGISLTLSDRHGAPDRSWYPSDTDAEQLAIALIQATPDSFIHGTHDDPGVRANYDDTITWSGDDYRATVTKEQALALGLALIRAARKP